MQYVELGNSRLRIPKICLGTNNFGGQVQESTANQILDTAFDLGVNMVDTADIYTGGKSEEIIGKWAKKRRKDVIIATKVGMEDPPDVHGSGGLSSENISYHLKKSLERLETDYIDLYYVHQFDPNTSFEETLETLDKLVRENLVRYIACSNFSARQISDAMSISGSKGIANFFTANQIRYNIFQRDVEADLLPFCKANSIGILAYSPLRSGLLAGRYRRNEAPPPDSRGSFRGKEYLDHLKVSENIGRIEKLEHIAKEVGLSLPALSIAWILRDEENVSSAVVGASRPEQFVESSKAAEAKLSSKTIEQIDDVARKHFL